MSDVVVTAGGGRASPLVRAAALVAGVVVLLGGLIVSLGGVILAPIGMAIAGHVQRRRGRPLTRAGTGSRRARRWRSPSPSPGERC